MKMKIKTRSYRHGINRPRSKYGHKYNKHKKSVSIMILACIKKHPSSIYNPTHNVLALFTNLVYL